MTTCLDDPPRRRMSELADYTAALRAGEVAVEPGALPPHYPTCFGCGPDAAWGLHVTCRRDGDDVVVRSVDFFSQP